MTQNKNEDRLAKVFIKLPYEMRKRIKLIAAMNDKTMNQQIINFIDTGLGILEKKLKSKQNSRV